MPAPAATPTVRRVNRTVTVLLLDPNGESLGPLPPFDVPAPWWQETSDVVAVIQEQHGLAVDVLRILTTERAEPPGGAVTYLAQIRAATPTSPPLADPATRDQPKRAAYARPGGPARSLAWATGITGPARAVQQRTWNLSAIWALETPTARYWLKQVPAWLPREPVVLNWFAGVLPELVPRLLAVGPDGCELLADVPGVDLYDADLPTRLLIEEQAHRFQVAALGTIGDLVAAGIPDRRGPELAEWIRASLSGWKQADDLLSGLDERLAAVADCGLPGTLVHGDAHPGNARRDGARLVILDWSDCAVDHPGFDVLDLAEGLPDAEAAVLFAAWADRWRRQVPGCEPDRALDLLRPVVALRSAALYAEFVAHVEPAEHRYHVADVEHLLEGLGRS